VITVRAQQAADVARGPDPITGPAEHRRRRRLVDPPGGHQVAPRARPAPPGGVPTRRICDELDNTVTDRLLGDARRKTARSGSPGLGKAAMIVGIIALVVSPISIAGWIVGATAVGMGVAALRRTAPPKQARLGIGLGWPPSWSASSSTPSPSPSPDRPTRPDRADPPP
jgi:hypothetical protein